MVNPIYKKKILSLLLRKKTKIHISQKLHTSQSKTINFFNKQHRYRGYEKFNTGFKLIQFHWPKRDFFLKKHLSKDCLFLDVGCGAGAIGRSFLKGYEHITNYTGIDLSSNLKRANTNKYLNSFIMKNNVENINFKNNTFKVVLCHGVLKHVRNYKKTLHEISRVMLKKGILFITIDKTLPLIANITNSLIRKKMQKMPGLSADLALRDITNLGKSFRLVNNNIKIKKNLKSLGIPKGKYLIHELIHYYMFRCFYNLNWPYSASLTHNRDWYTAEIEHDFSINEIEKIFKSKKLKILNKYSPSALLENYVLQKI